MKQTLLTVIISLFSFGSIAQTLEDDRLALVIMYYSMGGQGWFTEQRPEDYHTWQVPGKPGDSPCGWEGVTCEGGRVVEIALFGNDIEGTIPNEIGNLTALKSLVLDSQSSFFNWRVF